MFFSFLLGFSHCFAQKSIRDSAIAFPMIGASFQYQVPGADMAKRFKNNFNLGMLFQWKLKSNWIFGVEGNFLFAENIKETDNLAPIATSEGQIIDQAGTYANVLLQERGILIYGKAGKVFPIFGPNPNSGLVATVGVGVLQHKIRIETRDDVPQLADDYKKGYDRLSNGLSLTEFIGYMHFGNSRLINFSAGFEFTQGFTKNRRDYNFDTMMKDNTKRLDLLSGIKLSWFFPLYKHAATAYYSY